MLIPKSANQPAAKVGAKPGVANGSTDAIITQTQSEIDKLIADHLTLKVQLTWSPKIQDSTTSINGFEIAKTELKLDQIVQKWLSKDGNEWLGNQQNLAKNINVELDIPSWSRATKPQPSSSVNDGFVLRDPAVGIIRVCKGDCPVIGNVLTLVDNVLSATNVAVPQLGRRLIMPLHNPIFSNDSLDVSMSEDGIITKLSLHSTGSADKSISALGGNFDAIKSTLDAQAKASADATKAGADALSNAQSKVKNDNKILADCLDAQITIAKDGGTPIGACQ